MFSFDDIVRQFQILGIQKNDILLVHSSFKSLRPFSGSPDDFINALLMVIGPDGTLLMPSFQRGYEFFLSLNHVVFDVRNTPCELGIVPETFRKRSGVSRSLNPTHSVAGYGPAAEELLKGHEKCRISAGNGSPFDKLCHLGGKILLLGVPQDNNTTLHYLENVNGAPTICRIVYQNKVIDNEGRQIIVPTMPHMPGLPRNYSRVDAVLDAAHAQVHGKVGAAECRLINAAAMAALLGVEIQRDPLFLIQPFKITVFQ